MKRYIPPIELCPVPFLSLTVQPCGELCGSITAFNFSTVKVCVQRYESETMFDSGENCFFIHGFFFFDIKFILIIQVVLND